MSTQSNTITFEEWEKALFEAEQVTEAGESVAEIVDRTGWSKERVRKTLAKGIKAKQVRLGSKTAIRIDGKPCTVPAYIFISAPKKGKK